MKSAKTIRSSIVITVAMLGVPKVNSVRSSSMFGFSSIYVIFEDGVEFYWSRSRILEKLAALDHSLPLVEVLWRRERDAEAIDTPERQAGLETRLMQAAAQIKHQAVKAAPLEGPQRGAGGDTRRRGGIPSHPAISPSTPSLDPLALCR